MEKLSTRRVNKIVPGIAGSNAEFFRLARNNMLASSYEKVWEDAACNYINLFYFFNSPISILVGEMTAVNTK
jgi:hypothetical protein